MIRILILIGIVVYFFGFAYYLPKIVKQSIKASKQALTLSVCWLLMFLGLGVFFGRHGSVTDLSAIDSSATYQIICTGITVFFLFLKLVPRPNALKFILFQPLMFLTCYVILGIVSASFSPTPEISFYKATLLLIDLLLVSVVLYSIQKNRKIDPHLFLDLCYFIASLFLFGALLGAFLNPYQNLIPSKGILNVLLRGSYPFMNSNELGFLSAVVLVAALCRFASTGDFKAKIFWGSHMVVGFITLFLAQARTALVSTFLALIILSVAIKNLRWVLGSVIVVIVTSICFNAVTGGRMPWEDSVAAYVRRGQSEGGLQTIKGRAKLWGSTGIEMFLDAPFLGHGYDAGVRYGGSKYGISKTHMHNSHFQILVNSGALGYICWILFVSLVAWRVFQLLRLNDFFREKGVKQFLHFEAVAILIIILLRSITGQVLVTHQWSLMIFLGLFIYSKSITDQYNNRI